MTVTPDQALSGLPTGLRTDLLSAYQAIVKNFRERRWEPSELNAGKLCEATYSIVRGLADGSMPSRAVKPRNMVNACQSMEQVTSQSRAVRIQIPRMIVALYEIRNNRGVGHAGGDVEPNEMDAVAVLYMSKWLLAELIRVLHSTSTAEAEEIVASLVERESPLIWAGDGTRRVLQTGLTKRQQVLLLLASETGAVAELDLLAWLEQSSRAAFRRDVLRPMHRDRSIELNEDAGTVRLLPPGSRAADELLRSLTV